MGKYYETKHDAYNLKFINSAIDGKSVVVDETDTPFLWIDKESGKVSFGGKYFNLYKEQRLLEVLLEFVYTSSDYVNYNFDDVDYKEKFEKILQQFEKLNEDFKIK